MRFIPKHYLLTNPLFLEDEELIKWKYTDTILVTAYDLIKNDHIIYKLQSEGNTLKEYIRELGFPRDTKILADSGVFVLEWLKKTKSASLNYAFSTVALKVEDVIEAYKMIDPDYLVPLDEIILAKDNEEKVKEKVEKIKENVLKTLEEFQTSKIIGAVQGVREKEIYEIVDFEKEQGIRMFARGGLIPLYYTKYYCDAVKTTREATKGYKLHAFGVAKMKQIDCYAKCLGMDSFDSTIAKPITAAYFFLDENLKKRPFNDELVGQCGCRFCRNIEKLLERGLEMPNFPFTLNLYLHNIQQIYNYSKKLRKILVDQPQEILIHAE